MAISAKDVKRLRDITGVGMMDCKKALEEAGGDFDAAIDLLRKKGQKVAAKRADREANEGLIVTAATDDQRTAVLVEVNCETDFVARNEEFQQFAQKLADLVLRERPADREALLALPFEGGRTVADALTDMTGKIGEKIDVRRFAVVSTDTGKVVTYIHPGARLGVLVEVEGEGDVETAGRDVAMQVAALNPVAVTVDEVPEEVKAKELEIAREAARNEGKPEHILENIAQGKLKRFFKDSVLVEQPFVKDASMTVKEMLKQAGATVKRFVRFALGE
ncbi:MAG: elongation factor Ts [Bacteroidetes bacterium]|nr:MAG: elongation factor Ts [Bacteroidota bacterium]GIV58773.1 MAG: elongation factor Ts [Rhodothermaceae bacterium]